MPKKCFEVKCSGLRKKVCQKQFYYMYLKNSKSSKNGETKFNRVKMPPGWKFWKKKFFYPTKKERCERRHRESVV